MKRIALSLLIISAVITSLSAQKVYDASDFCKKSGDAASTALDPSLIYDLPAEVVDACSADELYKTARYAARGFSQDRDMYKALAYMKAAADKGNPDAAIEYSLMLISPDLGLNDRATARFYERNAMSIYEIMGQKGDAIGFLRLGNLYCRDGLDYKRDTKKALRYYERAASMGDMHSMRILGQKYLEDGKFSKALDYLTPAAERGEGIAQYELGKMYRDGRGVKADREKAIFWLQKAASGTYMICLDARRDLDALLKK